MPSYTGSNGKEYESRVGTKAKVYHGTAYCTRGGVKRDGLLQRPDGRIVFRSRSEAARKGPGFSMLPRVKKGTIPEAFKAHVGGGGGTRKRRRSRKRTT